LSQAEPEISSRQEKRMECDCCL